MCVLSLIMDLSRKRMCVELTIWLRAGTGDGPCECGHEPSGPIKCGEFLD